MAYFLPLAFLLFAGVQGEQYLYGQSNFPTGNQRRNCHKVSFRTPFKNNAIHIQTAFYHSNIRKYNYQAVVGWVEGVDRIGFKACAVVAESNHVDLKLKLNWIAYDTLPKDCQDGKFRVPLFATGSVCNIVSFDKAFSTLPIVFVTVRGEKRLHSNDAVSVWVDNVTKKSFKACLRELKNFAGAHSNIAIDWIALTTFPKQWKVHAFDLLTLSNVGSPTAEHKYSFCKDVHFPKPFYRPPIVITTATHGYGNNAPIAGDDAITEWIESITIRTAKVCLKDFKPLTGHHQSVGVHYMAIGDLDPCLNVKCTFFATCKAFGPQDGRCVCEFTCLDYQDPLCSRELITYDNMCTYKQHMCKRQTLVPTEHAGSCKHFVLQRGHASLDLTGRVVQCTPVAMDTKQWYKDFPVRVLLTVNYNSNSLAIVHDAITTWVEGVSHGNFSACALQAGRRKYEVVEGSTSESMKRLVTMDWIAYQGSPRGGVTGEVNITNWWDGTTCKTLMLPKDKFSSPPSVLVTSKHTIAYRKHDAATVWTEDVTSRSFKVCLRELQNFDGLHEHIRVSWLAYEYLPRNHFSEHNVTAFSNSQPPLYIQNNAFCKSIMLKASPLKIPTIIISASHTSTTGKVSPRYNSIASWVESSNRKGFRVCIKEFHDRGHYDPVTISWAVLPDCDIPLGMARGSIKDHAITASTHLKTRPPHLARLFKHDGAWCPAKNKDQWLQVDLGHVYSISGVATRGMTANKHQMWVKTYRLAFSRDGQRWLEFHERKRIPKVLKGNYNGETGKRNLFTTSTLARFVRFLPLSWHGMPCLRTEIYGCDTESIHVKIVSMGFDDRTAGRSVESSIIVDGIERSPRKRGHNIAVLNTKGDFTDAKAFDTFAIPQSGTKMAKYIKNIPNNSIVLVAVQGNGNSYIAEAESALRSLGAQDPIMPGLKGSWVLVGYKTTGPKPNCILQMHHGQGKGPTIITTGIPVYA